LDPLHHSLGASPLWTPCTTVWAQKKYCERRIGPRPKRCGSSSSRVRVRVSIGDVRPCSYRLRHRFFWRFDRKAILAQFWRMRQTIAPLRLAHSIGTGLIAQDLIATRLLSKDLAFPRLALIPINFRDVFPPDKI
jgi:hypothetical protein